MGISFVDKLAFTKHLAIMIKSGISLGSAINTLVIQTKGSPIQKVLVSIENDINNGKSLADALSRFPKTFDELYVNMIAIGEESGNLEKNLSFLSEHLTKEDALRKKIQGAMLYPTIVLVATLIVSMGIGLFILPQFIEFFGSFNVELPVSTKILLAIAGFMKNYGVFFFAFIILGSTGLGIFVNSKPIKPIWHRIQLRIPIFGKIIRYSQLTNFSRNLGLLLGSGINVTRSLETTANTVSNLLYREKINKINSYLKRGKNMADVIQKEMQGEFPLLVARMIAVGEETGNLEETLFYLSDFYENEIDVVTKRLTTVLEPLLLLGIGLVVAFVALAIITPIYELTGSIRR
ncbi:type II secretion system F family protein [Candidatus Woesebacteria bacterium]|nr:type II secretion system F family protein [Candidatus Woesebacteria bacterium]